PDVFAAASRAHGAKVLLVQLETPIPTVLAALQAAAEMGMKTILNPAPAAELPDEVLELTHLITPNETEAELLTGVRPIDDPSREEAAKRLLDRGVREVIITLGAEGCFYSGPAGSGVIPALRVKPVDTVAAGDAFNGALALSVAGGTPIPQSMEFANKVAAISVTRSGAQASMPTDGEVVSFSALG
ncbi:MAG TPA: PfkB family carbohydrate kinase, partial [Fimbriimonadaceae bacterium]|nr:PfkB family carbohydrate kinase [Fimbriimonadaceae bacterium]